MIDLGALGERVRAVRAEKGYTLQELASHAGVSVSMLSSVEHGDKAPTVVVLDRIAGGLGTPLTSLLADQEQPTVILRRAADQDSATEPGGWERTVLTPVIPGVNFEWIRSRLPAGCDAGVFPAYAAGSHEFVVVEAGSLRLTVDAEPYDLRAGDSLSFAADVPHGYANVTSRPCTYHVAALTMRSRVPGTRAVSLLPRK